MQNYSDWLSQLFNQSEFEVQRLLADGTAMQFLLAWSLFESKCFKSDLRSNKIADFASELASSNDMILDSLSIPAVHFHVRYQSPSKLANLMPSNRAQGWMVEEFKNLLAIPFDDLTKKQTIEFLSYVVYRFRNNIFHGSKGVQSWLQYREQIQLCVQALQVFVSYAEAKLPTMNDQGVA